MNYNSFLAIYKNYTTADLLAIIKNAEQYQQAAIEAAQTELNNRQLSGEDLRMSEMQLETIENLNQIKASKSIEKKVRVVGNSLILKINPFQDHFTIAQKYVKLITIYLVLLFLYSIYRNWFWLTNPSFYLETGYVFELAPLLIMLLAPLLLWKQKSTGWVLSIILLIYSGLLNVLVLVSNLMITYPEGPFGDLIPQPSLITLFLGALFYFGLTLVLFRNDIREMFRIDKSTMIVSISIGILTGVYPALVLFI